MPYSDRKKVVDNRRYATVDYDTEDRKSSRAAYDRAADNALHLGQSIEQYLLALDVSNLISLHNTTTTIERYGRFDWGRLTDDVSAEVVDILLARILEEKTRLQAHYAEESRKYKMQVRINEEQENEAIRKDAHVAAGMLEGDFSNAFRMREAYGREEGDWLDDPASAYQGQGGFGEEVKEQSGVKVQVTLSLDCSTSMWENDVARIAIDAYINLGLALNELRTSFPGSVYAQSFLFAIGEQGDVAEPLSNSYHIHYYGDDDLRLDGYEGMKDLRSWSKSWCGNDTRISPLLTAIEDWEMLESDSDCVKMDIILTDGVLEHKDDILEASAIQERRDGVLRTIMLNFLPESSWYEVRLPYRCLQLPVQKDNLQGVLRNLLAEFVSVYI